MIQLWKKAPVIANESLTQSIFALTIELTAGVEPGQFVMLGATETHDPLLNRPFSVHDAGEGWVKILYKVIGRGTEIIARVEAGHAIRVIGPLGRGFRNLDPVRQAALVGGGMGSAPLLLLAKELVRRGTETRVFLGMQTAREIEAIRPAFDKIGRISLAWSTDDGTSGRSGLVTDLLIEKMRDELTPWTIFTCGPVPMMRSVVEFSQRKNWPCQVSMETRMACGIAACLGCTIERPHEVGMDAPVERKYQHVCKDGPVFDAREVSWA